MSSSSSSSTKFCFFACLLLFTFSHNLVAGQSDKVKLNLYYESLCPSCQNFIVHHLGKIFNTDLHTITDLKLIPFGFLGPKTNPTRLSIPLCKPASGRASNPGDGSHSCNPFTTRPQGPHGEEECKLNALEACAIRTWPNQRLHYKFIRCVETNTNAWESCVKKYGGEKAINDCYNGDLSKELILGYANQTLSLKPEHKYVPWMTLNGVPLYENIGDFVDLVCKAYKGKAALPQLCYSSVLSQRTMLKLEFSYVDEAINH